MNKYENVYYPLDHFTPPVKTEKITLRECRISKLQWELEKHLSRSRAEQLTKTLEANGFTCFQKLLDSKLSDIQKINGIGPKSIEAIIAVRASFGVKEQ